jgi:hypothetical protein
MQVLRTAGLQLSLKRSLGCTLLRAAETAAAIALAGRGRGPPSGYAPGPDGAAARASWVALLLAATSAAGVATATAGDYALRRRFLAQRGGGCGGGGVGEGAAAPPPQARRAKAA